MDSTLAVGGTENRVISVSHEQLLLVYAVLPVFWGAVLADWLFLDFSVVAKLPSRPEMWMGWLFLFGLPHVLGGLITLADREYIQFYGKELLYRSGLTVLLSGAMFFWLGFAGILFLLMVVQVYHIVSIQFGRVLEVTESKANWAFQIWRWGSVASGIMLFFLIYLATSDLSFYEPVLVWCWRILLVSTLAGLWFLLKSRRDVSSVIHVLANIALMWSALLFFEAGYPVFTAMAVVAIHEAPFWILYATHDHNRNLEVRRNGVYRIFEGLNVPPFYLGIGLVFSVGAGVTWLSGYSPVVLYGVLLLTIFHGLVEGVVWRKGSIHRRFTPMNAG